MSCAARLRPADSSRKVALPRSGSWQAKVTATAASSRPIFNRNTGFSSERAGSAAMRMDPLASRTGNGHQIKGALRASLHDRHSPTLDLTAAHKGSAAIRKTGTDQEPQIGSGARAQVSAPAWLVRFFFSPRNARPSKPRCSRPHAQTSARTSQL